MTYRGTSAFTFDFQTASTFTHCILALQTSSRMPNPDSHSTAKEWSTPAITRWGDLTVGCHFSPKCLCGYLVVYHLLSYYFIKMSRKQKNESGDTSGKKRRFWKRYAIETKMAIFKQLEDRGSCTLIQFS